MLFRSEQKVLAEYNGWGGLKDAFREGTKENNELKELLSESEYKAAKASTLDAFILHRQLYGQYGKAFLV